MDENIQGAAAPGAVERGTDQRGAKRHLIGRVISDTSNKGRARKTITVEIIRRVRDAVYGKYVRTRKRFHAHDETEQFKTNDLVEIRESRPLSATKRWVAVRLVERPEEV